MVAICRRKLLLLLLIRRRQKRSSLKYRKRFWVRPINQKRKQQGEYANLIIYGQEVGGCWSFHNTEFSQKLILSIRYQQTSLAPPGSPDFGVSIFNFFCMCLSSHAILPLREMLSPLNRSQLQSGTHADSSAFLRL